MDNLHKTCIRKTFSSTLCTKGQNTWRHHSITMHLLIFHWGKFELKFNKIFPVTFVNYCFAFVHSMFISRLKRDDITYWYKKVSFFGFSGARCWVARKVWFLREIFPRRKSRQFGCKIRYEAPLFTLEIWYGGRNRSRRYVIKVLSRGADPKYTFQGKIWIIIFRRY